MSCGTFCGSQIATCIRARTRRAQKWPQGPGLSFGVAQRPVAAVSQVLVLLRRFLPLWMHVWTFDWRRGWCIRALLAQCDRFGMVCVASEARRAKRALCVSVCVCVYFYGCVCIFTAVYLCGCVFMCGCAYVSVQWCGSEVAWW